MKRERRSLSFPDMSDRLCFYGLTLWFSTTHSMKFSEALEHKRSAIIYQGASERTSVILVQILVNVR
ncbi:hypothetical protein H6G90_14240 [Nostoc sp. FACHB-145]|nr:hypothetical protein [Nostoc sp. FACHB-145]